MHMDASCITYLWKTVLNCFHPDSVEAHSCVCWYNMNLMSNTAPTGYEAAVLLIRFMLLHPKTHIEKLIRQHTHRMQNTMPIAVATDNGLCTVHK